MSSETSISKIKAFTQNAAFFQKINPDFDYSAAIHDDVWDTLEKSGIEQQSIGASYLKQFPEYCNVITMFRPSPVIYDSLLNQGIKRRQDFADYIDILSKKTNTPIMLEDVSKHVSLTNIFRTHGILASF